MSKGYSMWQCWVKGCGREMSAAGRYRHLMGHFNQGEITRDWIPDGRRGRSWDGYWHFRNWKKDEDGWNIPNGRIVLRKDKKK